MESDYGDAYSGLKASTQAQLASDAGIDGARQKEITAQLGNVLSNSTQDGIAIQQGFATAKTHALESAYGTQDVQQHAQTYQTQLAKVIQSSESYSERAAESDSFGESLSLDYNNTETRLNKADLNQELNHALDSHGTVNASKARKAAVEKIAKSGYKGDPESFKADTLKAFLALKSLDPDKARAIASKAFAGEKTAGADLKASSFENSAPSVAKIVSPEQAQAFEAQAGTMSAGAMAKAEIANGMVAAEQSHGEHTSNVSSVTAPSASTRRKSGSSASKSRTYPAADSATLGSGHYSVNHGSATFGGSVPKTAMDAVKKGFQGAAGALGDHAQIRNEINNAPLVDKNAKEKLEHTVYDNSGVAREVKRDLEGIGDATTSITHLLNGIGDYLVEHEQTTHSNISKDDLPPVPKD